VSPRQIITKIDASGTTVVTTQQKIRVWMQVIVTFIVLVVCFLILLAPTRLLPHSFDETTKRFAAGWIGLVIGYWLS
jgi:hypothetical protein